MLRDILMTVEQMDEGGFTGGAAVTPDTPAESDQSTTTDPVKQNETPSTPQPNWDDEQNPYRSRFTGLQGNFKQVRQQLGEVNQQLNALRIRNLELEESARGTPPDSIEEKKQAIQLLDALMHEKSALAEEKASIDAMRKELSGHPMSKKLALSKIAEQYGIQADDLDEAENVTEAVALAKYIAKHSRTDQTRERQANGTDRVESGGRGVLNDDQFINEYASGMSNDHARWRKIRDKLT